LCAYAFPVSRSQCVIQSLTLVNRASLTSGELIQACIESGDKAVWEEFVRTCHPVIAGVVSRTARRFGDSSPQLVDDLIQETYLKLCANLRRIFREFSPRAEESIFGLLKTVALSVTHDHFRGVIAEMRGGGNQESTLDNYLENTVAACEGLPEVERGILLQEIDDFLTEPSELGH